MPSGNEHPVGPGVLLGSLLRIVGRHQVTTVGLRVGERRRRIQYVLRVWQKVPMPPEFAVTMGEWLYNVRSTLDYLIWATAVYVSGANPPPSEDRLQYPIYDSEQAWRSNLYRLEPLAEHHREMLHMMQPFASDADANYLGWINRLARIDRHRRLVAGTAYLAEIDPVVQVPAGSNIRFEWGERVLAGGREEVARISVSPWHEGIDVAVNPRVGIDPEVAEWSRSPFWGNIRFAERLTMMQLFLAGEIAAYEHDCTGQSRKADLLTSDFRAQADARRRRRPAPQPPRPPVVWEDAGPGTPSSAARFTHGPLRAVSSTGPDECRSGGGGPSRSTERPSGLPPDCRPPPVRHHGRRSRAR